MKYTLSARIRPGFKELLHQIIEEMQDYLSLEEPNGDPVPGYPPEFQYIKITDTKLAYMGEQEIKDCQPEYVLQFLSPFVFPGAVLEEQGETTKIFKLNDKGGVFLMLPDTQGFKDPPIKPLPDSKIMYEFIKKVSNEACVPNPMATITRIIKEAKEIING